MRAANTELTYKESLNDFMKLSWPYTASRILLVLPWLFDGMIMKELGPTEVLAAPTITSIKAVLIGVGSAFMITTGFVGGKFITKGDKLSQEGKHEEANAEYARMGRTVRQNTVIVIPLALIPILPLYFISSILRAVTSDFSPEVADTIQNYFRTFVWSIFPTLCVVNNKNFAVAAKKPMVTLVATVGNLILYFSIAYPLALCTSMGVKGLGIGSTVSAWATLICLNLYYFFTQVFSKYNLFHYQDAACRDGLPYLSHQGMKTSLLSLAEWSNILIITLFAAKMGSVATQAVQASLQLIVPLSFLMLAFSRSGGVLISRYRGYREHAIKMESVEGQKIWDANLRKMAHINYMVICALSLTASVIISIFSEQFSKLFTHASSDLDVVRNTLLLNCAGSPFDAAKIASIGNLRGHEDTTYPLVVTAGLMFLVALPVSTVGVFAKNSTSPYWLFVPRIICLAATAAPLVRRCLAKNQTAADGLFNNHTPTAALLGAQQTTYDAASVNVGAQSDDQEVRTISPTNRSV